MMMMMTVIVASSLTRAELTSAACVYYSCRLRGLHVDPGFLSGTVESPRRYFAVLFLHHDQTKALVRDP